MCGYRSASLGDMASVYYDNTDASVIPNYGDFLFPKIFLDSRINLRSFGYADFAPVGACVGYRACR